MDDFDAMNSFSINPASDPSYLGVPIRTDHFNSLPCVSTTDIILHSDTSAPIAQPSRGIALSLDKPQCYIQPANDSLLYSVQRCSPVSSPGSKADHTLGSVVRTRRRKAGISDEERICIVCGEPASGYNFDRLTCESCKAFFRRNALKPKDKIKVCNRGGGCIIEGNQRKHCPSCRLQKCFAVGMKRELILPPEKLEQRAKPRRRKPMSPSTGSGSPSVGTNLSGSCTNLRPSHLNPSAHSGSHPHRTPLSGNFQPISMNLASHQQSDYLIHRPILNPIDSNLSNPCLWLNPLVGSNNVDEKDVFKPEEPSVDSDRSSTSAAARLVPCRHTNGRTVCEHQRCKRAKWRGPKDVNSHGVDRPRPGVAEPDPRLMDCLRECAQRIREPFTPDEKLDTGVAVTLEQEYNRMDACIRRIIRVVKLLPCFNDTGKQAQLSLLRANIYGLLVLYSSFFYERAIQKLRYPVLQSNGESSFVVVSMMDEVISPCSPHTSRSVENIHLNSLDGESSENFFDSDSTSHVDKRHSELREEFELYKANTLAAFEHLDQLVGDDDIVRVTLLAIKLFTDDSVSSDDLNESVEQARQVYLLFLWAYLRWRAGPKQLRSATELYARLLISFIDLRTLELRMTDFAKLLSLDCLSPLMREVCSQRSLLGTMPT